MEQTHYRADIDGLRGIAVLSVLLYHLDVTAIGGGYVGVDIFFVISGFLITRLIRAEVLNSSRFSFANFYLRRARRLLPAFFFTLTLCFGVAFFLFPPPLMEQFSGSLVHSVISLANFHFWGQSGYFDSAALYKPLLHIWSLSVEEQFYLLWPLLLVFLLLKTPRRAVPAALVLGFGISLYLNFIFADGRVALLTDYFPAAAGWFGNGPSTIFYLMPFRIFEFAAGALLVWIIEYQPRNKLMLEPLMLAGLVLTAYPLFTYTEKTLFPSYNALLPCLGAALLIYSGQSRHAGSLLRTPILVEIGRISYSLYLFHWPLIVFYKYYIYDFDPLSIPERLAIGAVSILAAKLMVTFVEQPFRKSTGEGQKVPTRTFLAGHAALGIVLMLLAAGAWRQEGWAWRMPNSITSTEIANAALRHADWQNGCRITHLDSDRCRPAAPLQVLFIGDSHYYVGFNMFAQAFHADRNINLISFSAVNNCDFVFDGKSLKALGPGMTTQSKCPERAAELSRPGFSKNLDVLVISSNSIFQKEVELPIIKLLRSNNQDLKIVIIGPYIDLNRYQCADIINRFGGSSFCKDKRFVAFFGGDVKEQKYYREYMEYDPLYIDVVGLLCPARVLANCQTGTGGVPMFYDSSHPTFEFSLLMGRRMLEEYSSELAQIGLPTTGK